MAENILIMNCTQCGEPNQLPAVHCKRCGAKLDFETAEQRMKVLSSRPPVNWVAWGIRWGVAALLLLVLFLTIWPGGMTRLTGEAIDARRYIMKRELLTVALEQRDPASQKITEEEINAFLEGIVKGQERAGSERKGPELKDMGVRFFEGRAELFLSVNRGPFTFTAKIYAKPDTDHFTVTGATVGHLPLPGFLGRIYASTKNNIFRQFKDEARILRHLSGLLVQDQAVELMTRFE